MTAEIRIEIDSRSVERARRAIHGASAEIEEGAVRFLLDGLGVESIAELKRLVDVGREAESIMGPIYEDLGAAGVPEDLLPRLGVPASE